MSKLSNGFLLVSTQATVMDTIIVHYIPICWNNPHHSLFCFTSVFFDCMSSHAVCQKHKLTKK